MSDVTGMRVQPAFLLNGESARVEREPNLSQERANFPEWDVNILGHFWIDDTQMSTGCRERRKETKSVLASGLLYYSACVSLLHEKKSTCV